VDVLARPEDLRLTATSAGSGIVTIATFLGSLTRVSVLLSEDVTVQVDVPSTEAPSPGAPVEVKMTDAPVLVTERR
jgi:putative spermidine/putrescine transport system ATP-binding protein